MATANEVLNVMRSWIGYSNANGKHRIIVDIYNNQRPLPRGYSVKYTDQWCATTVSAAAIIAGAQDIIGAECSCEEFIKIFKAKGIWNEDGRITPLPGDIILYNWDTKIQPNDGWSDHIGFVETVSNGIIIAIEGNKNSEVARRSISIGNGAIRGFARPKYDSIEERPVDTNANPPISADAAAIVRGKQLYDDLMAYLRSLPTSEYAVTASNEAIASGWFSDGDGDGLVDNPRAFVTRQDLALVLHNGRLF